MAYPDRRIVLTILHASASIAAVTLPGSVSPFAAIIASMDFMVEKIRSYVVVSAVALVIPFTPDSLTKEKCAPNKVI